MAAGANWKGRLARSEIMALRRRPFWKATRGCFNGRRAHLINVLLRGASGQAGARADEAKAGRPFHMSAH